MEFVVVAIAALLASGLTMFSGFGLGTLLLPVFALFLPVELAERLETNLVLDLAGPLSSRRVLDVGCGDGTYALIVPVHKPSHPHGRRLRAASWCR